MTGTRSIMMILATSLALSGCATFERSAVSGYGDSDARDQVQDFYREREQQRLAEAREELGFHDSRPLTDSEREALSDRMQLRRLESRLEGQREKRQYYRLKSAMRNDRERIQFLVLPSLEARERWAQNRGLIGIIEKVSEDDAKLIEENDIALRMTQKAVQESWGEPEAIEVAGDPIYGNERWRYTRFVSTAEGYNKQTRIIYFEFGRVVGWETF